jgi:hypothetical protein
MNLTNECYSINGKEYYSIKQMFNYYKLFLSCDPAYNTFYKRFCKWKLENSIQSVTVSGLKLFDKATAENFIEDYDYITHYSTSATNSKA